MVRPLWFIELLKKAFPQCVKAVKITKVPIIGALVEHMLFKGDEIYCIPKRDVIELNAEVEYPDNIVLPYQIIDYFIEKADCHVIMNFCICRASAKCRSYPIDLGCLFLGETAKKIDPRLGRRVTKEEARKHIKRAREMGLINLIGRNKLDTIWLDAKPGFKLLTICNCCPCCCLWRILPNASSKISDKVKKMPGISVEIDYDTCVGCGTCTSNVCFVNAIHMINNKPVINEDCRGCGRCVDVCPVGAIEIKIESKDFIEETIHRIASVVDVT